MRADEVFHVDDQAAGRIEPAEQHQVADVLQLTYARQDLAGIVAKGGQWILATARARGVRSRSPSAPMATVWPSSVPTRTAPIPGWCGQRLR